MGAPTKIKTGLSAETKVKEGYKKTKLGWIPKEWRISNFRTLTKINQGLQIAISERYTSKVPYSHFYITNEFLKIGSKSQYYILNPSPNVVCQKEDILMTRTGNTGQVVTGVEGAFHNNFFKIKFDKKVLSKDYLYYYLTSTSVQNTILVFAGISTIPDLNHSDFYKIKIPLPPLPEQKKIADILSIWDKAIETTQALIKKLQLRKKGLMQQLLTGKKRLPGFEGEWEFIKASELFANHTDKSHNGEFEVLSATQDKGVIPRSQTGIDIKYDKSSLKNYKKINEGDFVISLRSFQGGIEYSKYHGLVSPAYTVLKEKQPIDKVFYIDYFKTDTFIQRLNSIIYGIRDGKQISYRDFSSLKLHYPSIEEQIAIGGLITKADEEIHQTQHYLEQLREQKKGLMQQLLTGQKRVVV